jgi:predicted phage terminase large subunit-like protein
MFDNLNTLDSYKRLVRSLMSCTDSERIDITRYLCRTDLFFLLWYGFGRKDVAKNWLLARCKEIQAAPDEHLDLWAREHYKSTIITYALTIKDILASHGDNPLPAWGGIEPTFGIFSCTRPLAKGFLRQIKREFEGNSLLRALFPDVIWQNCHKEAPKWSEDDGLVLKRKSNPKESTVEAWGIVDGQPTGKHFTVCLYDDVVTVDNVRSPNMIAKTTESWELSINLGSDGGKRRYVGTRYHFNDTYRAILSRDIVTPRVYAATEDGLPEGEPVLLSKEALIEKRKAMGPYTFACQMLLNPLADETQGFKKDWIRRHSGSDGSGLNKYIIVDPASEKKKTSDYTAIVVIGMGADQNYYVLDMVRDRLNLQERADIVMRLHRKWRPNGVGYEKYGMQADIEYIKERQRRENYNFEITELGGKVSKLDRIRGLIPSFHEGKWYFPDSIFKNNYEGKLQDLTDIFINEELMAFPVSVHDDMLDCLARILDPDLNVIWPRIYEDERARDRYSAKKGRRGSAWAA